MKGKSVKNPFKAQPDTVQVQQAPVENLIKNHFKKIGELKDQIDVTKGAINDKLLEDKKYANLVEEGKAVAQERTDRKKVVVDEKNLHEDVQKIKDLRSELKEAKKALGQYLAQQYKETEQLTFMDHLGNEHGFEWNVRIRKGEAK